MFLAYLAITDATKDLAQPDKEKFIGPMRCSGLILLDLVSLSRTGMDFTNGVPVQFRHDAAVWAKEDIFC